MRQVLVILLVVVLAVPLIGCGRKGAPAPPGESSYPRTYPTK